jgi:hypothetical protein
MANRSGAIDSTAPETPLGHQNLDTKAVAQAQKHSATAMARQRLAEEALQKCELTFR